jgi:predicted acyltransferase (DUF342 family)
MCPTEQNIEATSYYFYCMLETRCTSKERMLRIGSIPKNRKSLVTGLLLGLVLTASSFASETVQGGTDTATLASGATIGNVSSSSAFTAGANSNINGFVTAAAAVTLGAYCTINGNVIAGAAFTSGDSCTIKGSVSAKAAFTGGANSIVGGNVLVGADFTSGANSIVAGDVYVTGAVTLGARSRILGALHSGTGVITYGKGATVGSVK